MRHQSALKGNKLKCQKKSSCPCHEKSGNNRHQSLRSHIRKPITTAEKKARISFKYTRNLPIITLTKARQLQVTRKKSAPSNIETLLLLMRDVCREQTREAGQCPVTAGGDTHCTLEHEEGRGSGVVSIFFTVLVGSASRKLRIYWLIRNIKISFKGVLFMVSLYS